MRLPRAPACARAGHPSSDSRRRRALLRRATRRSHPEFSYRPPVREAHCGLRRARLLHLLIVPRFFSLKGTPRARRRARSHNGQFGVEYSVTDYSCARSATRRARQARSALEQRALSPLLARWAEAYRPHAACPFVEPSIDLRIRSQREGQCKCGNDARDDHAGDHSIRVQRL